MVLSLNCCAPRNKVGIADSSLRKAGNSCVTGLLMFDSKHFFDKTTVVKRDTDWEILE
jgi:hypothetical protein